MINKLNEKKRKILICSLGSIGTYYLNLIKKKWPETRLSVLRSGKGGEKDEEILVENVFKIKEEAISWKPDMCIIASPASFHLSQSIFFANKNIPLLIEKPIGIPFQSQKAWESLVMFSEKIPISIAYIFRSHPAAKFLKSQLNKNKIGKIIEAEIYCGSWLPSWRPNQDYKKSVSAIRNLGGGVLLELSHEIDLALWLFGELSIINAHMKNSGLLDIDVEDQAYLLLNDLNGAVIDLRLNFCTIRNRRMIRTKGTKGEIFWDIHEGILSIDNFDGEKEIINFKYSKDDLFEIQLESFFNSLDSSENELCKVKEALSVLKIIEQSFKINDHNKK